MSCRTTHVGSFITSLARVLTGNALSDPAELSTFHELRRTYMNQPVANRYQYDEHDYQDMLSDAREMLLNATNITEKRRASLLRRLDAAVREGMPAGDIVYATRRIVAVTQERAEALNGYLRRVSERQQRPVAEIRTRFRELEESVERGRGVTPESFTDVNRTFVSEMSLGRDVGIVHAVSMLEEETQAIEIARARALPRRITGVIPFVHDYRTATTLQAGYDPTGDRRLEVTLGDGTVRAYRNVPQDVWNRMSTMGGERVWWNEVRGNASYEYTDEVSAAVAGCASRCPDCGQYANNQHNCRPTAPEATRRNTIYSRYTRNSGTRWTTDNVENPVLQTRLDSEGNVTASTGSPFPVRLPGVRRLRDSITEGDVTIQGIYTSSSITFIDTDYSGRQYNRRAWINLRGDVSVRRLEDGSLNVNASRLTCSCEEYQANRHCPHVDVVVNAVKLRIDPPARPRANSRSLTPEERAAVLSEAARRVEQESADDWMRSQETAAEAARTWRVEADALYSEDLDSFLADVENARTASAAKEGEPAVPFMKENALDGFCRRGEGKAFGVEIEFDLGRGVDYTAIRRIAQELYDAGLTTSPARLGYGSSRRSGFVDSHTDSNGKGTWSFESDGSVTGGELVTCGMYDEPETWERLDKAIEIITRNGGVASRRAGAHVHVGSSDYVDHPEYYTELARLVSQHEDVMFRLASDPKRGTHRRNHYAGRVSPVPASGFSDVTSSPRSWQGTRYAAVNFHGVKNMTSDHTEFRLFDSTLNSGAIQAQVKMAVFSTEAAKRNAVDGGTERGKENWGSHAKRQEARGSRRRMTTEELAADSDTTRSFLDTLFRRREDKAQLAAIFAFTKWAKPRS